MAKQVQHRRGTATQVDAFIGAEGEITVDSDTGRLRTHDGNTAGGVRHVVESDLGTLAAQNADNVNITGGSISGIAGLSEIEYALITEEACGRTKVNAAGHSSHRILSANQKQWVSWVDDDLNVYVAERDLGDTNWTSYDTGTDQTTYDSHKAAALGIDADGYLHLITDAHDSAFKYRKSTNPYDASAWGAESGVLTGSLESSLTYPYFFNLADGTLMLIYRQGTPDDGRLMLDRYDHTAGSWSQVGTLWYYGAGNGFSYLGAPVVDDSGVIHLAWTVWDPAISARRDIYYMRSADGGVSWTRADGTAITLPVDTDADADLVDGDVEVPITDPAYPANVPTTVDPQGRVVLTYKKQAANGDWHIYCAYYDAGWSIVQVTAHHEPVVPGDLADADLSEWGVPWRMGATDATVYIAMQNRPYGSETVLLEAMADDYSEWRRTLLHDQPLIYCTPDFDVSRLKSDGVLDVIITSGAEEGSHLVGRMPAVDLGVASIQVPDRSDTFRARRTVRQRPTWKADIQPLLILQGQPDSTTDDFDITSTSFDFLTDFGHPQITVPPGIIHEEVDVFVQWRVRIATPTAVDPFSMRIADGGATWFSDDEQHSGATPETKVSRWVKVPKSLVYIGGGLALFLQARRDGSTTIPRVKYRNVIFTLGIRPKRY